MITALRAIESHLERSFAKARKDISGRGALHTKVRIVDDVIFVKMRMDYSGLEKNLIRYILEQSEEANFYASVREQSRFAALKTLQELNAELNIKALEFSIDIENNYAFTTIVLTHELERLIKEGLVAEPCKAEAIPTP
ncbi:Na-translocating system protein MpsC family protein [Paenibacillus cremeus]|nr:Na-translocating system protein MpsC family protein [Paenibacillus cremeus]